MKVLFENNKKWCKRKYWLMLAMILPFFLIQVPSVSATTITEAIIEASPNQGDITTSIFVQVRGEPYDVNGLFGGYLTAKADYPRLYLYYDDKCIIQRMACVTAPGIGDYSNYWSSWDVTISVPNEYPYSELGVHYITAVIEASDGTTASTTTAFEIVSYIPPPEWWEDLPQDFLDNITGPQGPAGLQGIQGLQGEQGPKGDTGSYPIEALILNFSLSSIAVLMSLIALVKANRVT